MQIGACLFTIYSEIEPCQRMDELQPGLRNTLSLDMRGYGPGSCVEGSYKWGNAYRSSPKVRSM
jgi:hypothetical protein